MFLLCFAIFLFKFLRISTQKVYFFGNKKGCKSFDFDLQPFDFQLFFLLSG